LGLQQHRLMGSRRPRSHISGTLLKAGALAAQPGASEWQGPPEATSSCWLDATLTAWASNTGKKKKGKRKVIRWDVRPHATPATSHADKGLSASPLPQPNPALWGRFMEGPDADCGDAQHTAAARLVTRCTEPGWVPQRLAFPIPLVLTEGNVQRDQRATELQCTRACIQVHVPTQTCTRATHTHTFTHAHEAKARDSQ
jgi:hypothetical protein